MKTKTRMLVLWRASPLFRGKILQQTHMRTLVLHSRIRNSSSEDVICIRGIPRTTRRAVLRITHVYPRFHNEQCYYNGPKRFLSGLVILLNPVLGRSEL